MTGIRCPLEFSHADEVRAEKVGGFVARHYGCAVKSPDRTPPPPERALRVCVQCGEAKAWAGDHRRCPSCRAARERARASTPKHHVAITAEEVDRVLGGATRFAASRALGMSERYISTCLTRGTMPRAMWERLVRMCAK